MPFEAMSGSGRHAFGTRRSGENMWISDCGYCPWLGVFSDHEEATYRVKLHFMANHDVSMAFAGRAIDRVAGQQRIEALLG
jgi:hypothetical protein